MHERCLLLCLGDGAFTCSASLSLIPGRGAGHRPNPFQVAPEASRVGCEGVSWPGVPPGVIVGRTLEHQMLDRLVGAVAVWTDGRVPAPDTVKVSCYQWGMTSAYLCHRHALVPGPIPLPTLGISLSLLSLSVCLSLCSVCDVVCVNDRPMWRAFICVDCLKLACHTSALDNRSVSNK